MRQHPSWKVLECTVPVACRKCRVVRIVFPKSLFLFFGSWRGLHRVSRTSSQSAWNLIRTTSYIFSKWSRRCAPRRPSALVCLAPFVVRWTIGPTSPSGLSRNAWWSAVAGGGIMSGTLQSWEAKYPGCLCGKAHTFAPFTLTPHAMLLVAEIWKFRAVYLSGGSRGRRLRINLVRLLFRGYGLPLKVLCAGVISMSRTFCRNIAVFGGAHACVPWAPWKWISHAVARDRAYEHLVRNRVFTSFAGRHGEATNDEHSEKRFDGSVGGLLAVVGCRADPTKLPWSFGKLPFPWGCLKQRLRISCGLGYATRMRLRWPSAQPHTRTVRWCTWVCACTPNTRTVFVGGPSGDLEHLELFASRSLRLLDEWFQKHFSCKLATSAWEC